MTADSDGEDIPDCAAGSQQTDSGDETVESQAGYILYDGEEGRAHPTEPNSLDPFSFPDGVALLSGGSVRFYTGTGDSGDRVFY